MDDHRSRPPLSVVVATRTPRVALAEAMESLAPQVRALGAEIVVATGGRDTPDNILLPPGTIWVHEPEASVMKLRTMAVARARGEIVAMTEDHCRVSRRWCQNIIEIHAKNPEVAAIGGAVENAATATLTSRLHFLLAYGVFMRPLGQGGARFIAGEANVSYKRSALPSRLCKDGHQQMLFNQQLAADGLRVLASDEIVVFHNQPVELGEACRMHFHNGRCISGMRRPGLSLMALLIRLASCAVLPAYLVYRALAAAFRKGRGRSTAVIGIPILFAFASFHALGEVAGCLTGPGESPLHVP